MLKHIFLVRQNCRNFDLVPKSLFAEKCCPPKILSAEILSDKVFRLSSEQVMDWHRVLVFFTLLFLLHHDVGRIEARPQLNTNQQNVADVTSDDAEASATAMNEVEKNGMQLLLFTALKLSRLIYSCWYI